MMLIFYFHALCLASLAWIQSKAQFLPPPKDLKSAKGNAGVSVRYKEVPSGICESTPGVKSFSGYVDVSEKEHIFFWFFEARNGDPQSAPLTVWIEGSHGFSSLIGLFAIEGIGPCTVQDNGTAVNNTGSWSASTNMLYIDQPVGTGLSYSETVPAYYGDDGYLNVLSTNECPDFAQIEGTCGTFPSLDTALAGNSSQTAAPNVWNTLQGFMGVFPQYSKNGIHLTSRDYGGHYLPAMGAYIMRKNQENIGGAQKIDLKSVSISNGWFDMALQYPSYYSFTVQPGNTYDLDSSGSIQDQVRNALYGRGNCKDRLDKCQSTGQADICTDADVFCYYNVEGPMAGLTDRLDTDIRQLQPGGDVSLAFFDYLNSAPVQQATGMMVNFTLIAESIRTLLFFQSGALEESPIRALRYLLTQNVTVALSAGDADYLNNWYGVQAVAEAVGGQGFQEAGFAPLQTSDKVHHGDVRQRGRLSFTRVFDSGQPTSRDQPLAALEIFQRSISGLDIATGTISVTTNAYMTIGPKESTYREGNSTVHFDKQDGGSQDEESR